jgi:hypothetical protein
LWQWTFGGIDQEQNAINKCKSSLYFASEVSVSGCVNKVDLCATPFNLGSLCQNCDSSLTLLIIRVHYSIYHGLVSSECSATF